MVGRKEADRMRSGPLGEVYGLPAPCQGDAGQHHPAIRQVCTTRQVVHMKSIATSPANTTDFGPRRMVRAELMGSHSHATLTGVQVHVWRRGERYLGRGRLHGVAFGETLGKDANAANARLRQTAKQCYFYTKSSRRLVMRARLQSPQTPRMTKLWP